MGHYLDDARTLYDEALNELDRFQQTQNHAILRDAAEKGWGAVTLAANEVINTYGRKVPSGTGARRSELRTLERQDRRLRALRLEDRFNSVEVVLHRDCFYDGTCPLPMVTDMVIEDVKEYLDDVAQIIQQASR